MYKSEPKFELQWIMLIVCNRCSHQQYNKGQMTFKFPVHHTVLSQVKPVKVTLLGSPAE